MYCDIQKLRLDVLIIPFSLSLFLFSFLFFRPPQQEDDKVLKLVQKKFCASGPYTGKMSAKGRNGVFAAFRAVASILRDETTALQSRQALCLDSGV